MAFQLNLILCPNIVRYKTELLLGISFELDLILQYRMIKANIVARLSNRASSRTPTLVGLGQDWGSLYKPSKFAYSNIGRFGPRLLLALQIKEENAGMY